MSFSANKSPSVLKQGCLFCVDAHSIFTILVSKEKVKRAGSLLFAESSIQRAYMPIKSCQAPYLCCSKEMPTAYRASPGRIQVPEVQSPSTKTKQHHVGLL